MCKYYHLSETDNLTELIPHIPRYAVEINEDTTIPRVCFSNTIHGALHAIGAFPGDKLYVYTPSEGINATVPTKKQVKDAHLTGEVWSLNPVKVNKIGVIEVTWEGYGNIHQKVKENGYHWITKTNTKEIKENVKL